jgi:hypothetical protein
MMRAFDFFTISSCLEAIWRNCQGSPHFEDQSNVGVWYYPDGHVSYPRCYAQKRAGIYISFSQKAVEDSVNFVFGTGQLHESNLHAVETWIRLLHAKGYRVQMFWNPVRGCLETEPL